MIEEWRDVVGFEGHYQVSSMGRVKGISRITKTKQGHYRFTYKKVLKASVSSNMYMMVTLRKDLKSYHKTVHRLVAIAFIPNPKNKGDVNHIDADRCNNNLTNLEWATRSENIRHCIKLGNFISSNKGKTGKDCIFSKPVKQLNLKGEFVKKFESISEAQKVTGINNISKVCLGNARTSGGFKWEYLKT